MRTNYEPEKLVEYIDGFDSHLSNVAKILGLLDKQPRTRDTDILRDSLLRSTIGVATKLGETISESMLNYFDIELGYTNPDLITHTLNVPELDGAYLTSDLDEYDEEEDEDDEDYDITA